MPNPRDPIQKWGIPVNPWTGAPLTENQSLMLDRLGETVKAVSAVLHEIDGSDPQGEGYGSRRTNIAGTHLEQLQLIAMRELLAR
jgi:hypothetical protein